MEKEMFGEIMVNVYDENGEEVSTETITEADLIATAMGPMVSYSCEKTLTLDAGNYQISLTAKGNGQDVEDSDESERLSVNTADGGNAEGKTSGCAEEEASPF
jgi:hypothetical protein